MLTPQTIELVKATAPVVAPRAEEITRRFYQLMFAANPETRAYFNEAHQHSGGQQRALAGAICAYAANIDNLAALGPAVELIAQKHCSLAIQPKHYPIVGKHLLAAIKDVVGDVATDEILAAWGEAYGFLAEVFIGRERDIYAEQVAAPGGWNGVRSFVIARKKPENELVTSFYLRPQDGGALADFKPGQYITVHINEAAASPRNFSLSDRPGTGYYRISVKREPAIIAGGPVGAISNYLHDHIEEGDVLRIGPPCGEFTLDPAIETDRPIVLLAGGIGVTPLLSMLKSLAHHRSQRPVYFAHAARDSQVHALAAEVREAITALPNGRAHVRLSAPLGSDTTRGLCDSVGLCDAAFLKGWLPSADADYYFCGPAAFMAAIQRDLLALGANPKRLHFEFFGPRQELLVA